MANIRLIKNRIKSAKNIAQITKAMELVAASKMRKAQTAAMAGKLYASKIRAMVGAISAKVGPSDHALLAPPKAIKKQLAILITSNKGLCGGLNTNLFRFCISSYEDISRVQFVTIGKKGTTFVGQMHAPLVADFSDRVPFLGSVSAVNELIMRSYIAGEISGVDLLYNECVSAVKQIPTKKSLLPLLMSDIQTQGVVSHDFLIEPSSEEVFDVLLPHYLEVQLRDGVLQAEASEHSARMVAMKTATDNALSFMEELTLLYNKARQEKITYEISDIVTARLATE